MARLALSALLLVTLRIAPPAHADGVFFRTESATLAGGSSGAQKAIIIREGANEVLLLQTTYSGLASEFAWVVPVPARPLENGVFPASKDFIAAVLGATQPRVMTMVERLGEWDFPLV